MHMAPICAQISADDNIGIGDTIIATALANRGLTDANDGPSARGAFFMPNHDHARRMGRRRAGATLARPAKRYPRLVPLGFHVEMPWRSAWRQRGIGMLAEERRQPVARLQDRGERDHTG